MMQIPKNVMQIGEVNAHTKIYMEDYVHTFLERRAKPEEYLVFGKREEHGDVLYYFMYGVEKKTDWERGSYPYFKRYDRIGTIEGTAGNLTFRPVRGAGIRLDGYFVFYEQNEDMQSYMIVAQEAENIAGNEEKEAVMEAVRIHREQRQKELESAQTGQERRTEAESTFGEETHAHREGEDREEMPSKRRSENGAGPGRRQSVSLHAGRRDGTVHTLQRKAKKNAAFLFGRRKKGSGRTWTMPSGSFLHNLNIPDLCRGGSMILLLILVVMGLTSLNRYPDMKAVLNLFSDAAHKTGEMKEGKDDRNPETGLTVEEATVGQEESGQVAEATMDETETEEALALAEDGKIRWTIGQQEEQGIQQEAEVSEAETPKPPAGQRDEEERASEETTGSVAEQQTEAVGQEEEEQTTRAPETSLAEAESEEESVTQAIARPVSYVVKKGDSLAGIARKFYGNASMVNEICQVNQIENPDQIHPGQNILLP